MIDIGKKISFYFLQNVWKCTVFFAFAFKSSKSANMTQKKFFLKNITMGNQKTQNFMLISNSFRGFLLLTFITGIFESWHQRIWNQHEILRFLIPILTFFKKKFFGVIIAQFPYIKCKCEKNCTFSNILQKVKSNFLPISIILRLIPKKVKKLKPPTARVRLLVRERVEVLGRAGGLPSGPILSGLSRTLNQNCFLHEHRLRGDIKVSIIWRSGSHT